MGRVSSLAIATTAAPAFCVHTTNQLGTHVFSTLFVGQANPGIQTDITNGVMNDQFQFLGLDDPTGQNATGFSIGVLSSTLDPAKGTWPANNPEDWSFLADPTGVSMGLPTQQLTGGVITNNALTAGPNAITLVLSLLGVNTSLEMKNVKLAATVSSTTSTPAPPPSQLASGFVTFDSVSGSGVNEGLCGDITVESLAQTPIPSALTTGTTACAEAYTSCGANQPVTANCNSLLDAMVGGCKILGGVVTAINPTQPDVPGSGTTVLTLVSGFHKKVTVPSGDTDAYSSYFTLGLTREHFSGEACTASFQCQVGQTCTNGVCQ